MATRLGLQLVVQFGSTTKGRIHAHSDVDIGVLLDHYPSFDELGQLESVLKPLAGERPLDLAILNHADPLFLKQVSESARLVYGSPTRFHEFRAYAYRRYQDHRRYLALERDYVARATSGLAAGG